jgi:hypothetical protein
MNRRKNWGPIAGLVLHILIGGLLIFTGSQKVLEIVPLFADDLAAAEVLLRGLMAEPGGGTLFLDAPNGAGNAAATQLVGRVGLREVLRTARRYTQGRPWSDAGRVFGITSLESG